MPPAGMTRNDASNAFRICKEATVGFILKSEKLLIRHVAEVVAPSEVLEILELIRDTALFHGVLKHVVEPRSGEWGHDKKEGLVKGALDSPLHSLPSLFVGLCGKAQHEEAIYEHPGLYSVDNVLLNPFYP